jgi:cytochrome b561/polyisoprenoid-binding protein YceI
MTDDAQKYSRTAMGLHWIIALLLVFNHALGGRTEDLKRGAELFWVFQLHKSVGITILLLSLWRLWVRLRRPRPAAFGSGWTGRLASAVHWGFYAVMIGAPLSGWLVVSTAKIKIPTLLFGTIPWPHLPVGGGSAHAVHDAAEGAHGLLATLAIVLLFLHVAGALRHQFLLKEALVERMVPTRRVGLGMIALLIGSLAASFALGRTLPAPQEALGKVDPIVVPVATAPVPVAADVIEPEAPIDPKKTAAEVEAGAKIGPAEAAAKVAAPAAVAAAAVAANADPAKPGSPKATGTVPAWTVQPGGRLGFSVSVNGETVAGRFDRWTSNIRFDPDRLDQSAITATIDLASVSSGDGERDGMLVGSDFFSAAAHPRAAFTATNIRSAGPGRYAANGTLSLKGVSRPVPLSFTLDIKGDSAQASGTAQLDRRQFNVGEGQFSGTDAVGANVAITFSFAARK